MSGSDISLQTAQNGRAYGHHLVSRVLRLVDRLAGLGSDDYPLGIHPVLGKVFHIDPAELSDSHVDGDECFIYVLKDHPVEEFPAEVGTRCGNGHRPFVLREDGLVVLVVLRSDLALDPFRYGQFAEAEQRLLEVLVRSVVKETQGATPGGGVVNHFGDKALVLSEIEFVSYPDLAGGIHDHIPQVLLPVQFTKQEHHDVGSGLLLLAVKPGGEDFRVVEHEGVAFAEILDDVLEKSVLDLAGVLMDYHEFAFVAPSRWLLGHTLLREDELELG